MNESSAVVQAMGFLRQVHRDLASMVQSVDADLDQREWERTENGARITSDLSNALSPEKWAIKNLWRTYMPKEANGTNPKAVFGFWICLEPSHHDYAIAVAVSASLKGSLPAAAIWGAWNNDLPLLKHLSAHPSGGPIPPAVVKDGFIEDAIAGAAFVAPLMEMVNMNAVRNRLIDPAFAAFGR